jgi:hypothetical protein
LTSRHFEYAALGPGNVRFAFISEPQGSAVNVSDGSQPAVGVSAQQHSRAFSSPPWKQTIPRKGFCMFLQCRCESESDND